MFLIVFIDLLGFSIIIPLFPIYTESYIAHATIGGVLLDPL